MITRNNLEGGIASTAVYSDCEHYRYSLSEFGNQKNKKLYLYFLTHQQPQSYKMTQQLKGVNVVLEY